MVILATEGTNPRSAGIDQKPTEELLRTISAEDRTVPLAVAREIPKIAEAAEAIAAAVRDGGRVFFLGAGTGGRLGVIEATEMPPTFGVRGDVFQAVMAGGHDAVFHSMEGAEDNESSGASAIDECALSERDVLVALSASGETPFVVGALRRSREKGTRTVCVTCNPMSSAAGLAKIPIITQVGEEVVAGSTRLKAGTAQKLVLNMLTTASMIRLGRVYDGYMVGVQPTNAKLKARAIGIVMAIAGLEKEEAEDALSRAGGDVRVAIVSARTRTTPEEARKTLDEAGGSLRRVLERSVR